MYLLLREQGDEKCRGDIQPKKKSGQQHTPSLCWLCTPLGQPRRGIGVGVHTLDAGPPFHQGIAAAGAHGVEED